MTEKEIQKNFLEVDKLLAQQDPKKALSIIYTVRKNLKPKQKWYLGRTYFWEQLCWKHFSDKKHAIIAGKKGERIFREIGDVVETSKIIRDRGLVYEYLHMYDKAEESILEALRILIAEQSLAAFGVTISKLGQVQYKAGKLEEGSKNILLGFNILSETDEVFFQITSILPLISVLIDESDYLRALDYIAIGEKKIKELKRRVGYLNCRREGELQLRKALIYLNLRSPEQGLVAFKKFAKLCLTTDVKEREFFLRAKEFMTTVHLLKEFYPKESTKILEKYL